MAAFSSNTMPASASRFAEDFAGDAIEPGNVDNGVEHQDVFVTHVVPNLPRGKRADHDFRDADRQSAHGGGADRGSGRAAQSNDASDVPICMRLRNERGGGTSGSTHGGPAITGGGQARGVFSGRGKELSSVDGRRDGRRRQAASVDQLHWNSIPCQQTAYELRLGPLGIQRGNDEHDAMRGWFDGRRRHETGPVSTRPAETSPAGGSQLMYRLVAGNENRRQEPAFSPRRFLFSPGAAAAIIPPRKNWSRRPSSPSLCHGRIRRACLNPVAEEAPHPAPSEQGPPPLRLVRVCGPRYSRADLRRIVGEGSAHAIMVGVGESYLPAFVLAMGMGQVAAGLITTIPLLAGAVLQLISPAAVRFFGSHRRWVVTCAAVQAGSFVPLAIAAWYGHLPVLAMFALAAIYWGAGLGTSTSWSTWVEKLIPRNLRTQFFSRRTRLNQIATLSGFVLGGFGLQWGAAHGCALTLFAVLFVLAAVSRTTSTVLLANQSEPEPIPNGHRSVPMREFFHRFRQSGDGRLLVYLLSVQAAAQIAGPYFTPFMIRSLKFSYVSYVTLIAISFAAKAITLPAIGALARRHGTRKLLWLGGIGIVPISGLWLVSNSFAFLCVVQLLAGIAWGAYELAMFLLFFETIRPHERTGMLTNFNFAHSLATAIGSLFGGALLWGLGKNAETYLLLFAISSVARAMSLVLLWRVPTASCAELLPTAAANVTVRPVPSRAA